MIIKIENKICKTKFIINIYYNIYKWVYSLWFILAEVQLKIWLNILIVTYIEALSLIGRILKLSQLKWCVY